MSAGARVLQAGAASGFVSIARQSLGRTSKPRSSSVPEHTKQFAEAANAVSTRVTNQEDVGSKGDLAGMQAAIKDNFCTGAISGFPTTCDSKILGLEFQSPYDATVVQLLEKAGCHVVGKTTMDEFGMGSHSIHTNFGEVNQLGSHGQKLSVGGSSGGSALAVVHEACDFALGTDTGGSVRLPAAYTGVVGFKPSYGLLSRWGVVAYANSLDTVGIIAETTGVVRKVYDVLNHFDPKDPTSIPEGSRSRITKNGQKREKLRIGIPLEYNIQELHPTVRSAWLNTVTRMSTDLGHTIHPVSLPRTKQALSAYYVLAPSEASSNLAKYDGIRYGRRSTHGPDNADDGYLYAKTRGEGFGPEVKRRMLLGAYSLSAEAIDNYFIQAQKVRRLIQRDFDNVFAPENPLHDYPTQSLDDHEHNGAEKVDFILCPTAPTPPPLLEEVTERDRDPLDAYVNDVFTVPASLAGLPAISVPAVGMGPNPEDNIGMQIIGQYGSDLDVLDLADQVERLDLIGR